MLNWLKAANRLSPRGGNHSGGLRSVCAAKALHTHTTLSIFQTGHLNFDQDPQHLFHLSMPPFYLAVCLVKKSDRVSFAFPFC